MWRRGDPLEGSGVLDGQLTAVLGRKLMETD